MVLSRDEINLRYRRKKGIGIQHECLICGKEFKKKGSSNVCSNQCKLLEKIVKKENGCWEWTGAKTYYGYGKIRVNEKHMLTHRYSYEVFKGNIPEGLCVCHTCDNPRCINPDHLFTGTHQENYDDMVAKGRRGSTKGFKVSEKTRELMSQIKKKNPVRYWLGKKRSKETIEKIKNTKRGRKSLKANVI